ncbi:hypothetical protein [Streptomyces roseoverticillatus]|uniref:hypothetical protein n=1 Tax=Streptomyces roseoverticillatus TaxID=66429 RepID=UPI0005BC7AB1|nr:hypothetical protein [Streptomyces roseoverticillatus]
MKEQNAHATQQTVAVHAGYPVGQLARAFTTAATHESPDTRRRAEERIRRWRDVVAGMAGGRLTPGSRTPVAGLPAWVTPEVVRGGFATGAASAGGPLLPYETETARRAGIPADRAALFAYWLSDAGLAELNALLDSGAYEVAVPEEAALLTVAWLLRSGDRVGALRLLEKLRPFAGRLRFAPRPGAAPLSGSGSGSGSDSGSGSADAAVAHRLTVGEAARAVGRRRPNRAVESMREALAVWNPFFDEMLALWLETAAGGRVLARTPDEDWIARGRQLLRRYERLSSEHTLCTKHRKPGENPSALRLALEAYVTGRTLDPACCGRLQHAVDSMVRRRGEPGSGRHGELRARQATEAARPSHHALAQLVARRLSGLPQDTGTPDVGPLVAPVTEEEARVSSGLTAGAEIPEQTRRVVESALSAPLATLVARGVVPSAEVLAGLVPQLVASTTALAYPDESLRALMTAHYRAFRNRRSLLLLNLERQVRIEELPWVAAVARQRRKDEAGSGARTALVHLAEVALQGFPATILPNPLVRELSTLAGQAGEDVPFVEELAADIFMGTFSGKFLASAAVAGRLLGGSLYECYYGLDYELVVALEEDTRGRGLLGPGTSAQRDFADLCHAYAGTRHRGWSVAANGTVIEQAQILTTHNLAALAGPLGAAPAPGWADLARRSFTTVCRLTARIPHHPRPLPTIKDAAYAWRQMLFHLSLCLPDEQAAVLAALDDEAARHPGHVAARLAPALAGLRLTAEGGSFDADGTADGGRARRFLGWATERHWMRDAPGSSAEERQRLL